MPCQFPTSCRCLEEPISKGCLADYFECDTLSDQVGEGTFSTVYRCQCVRQRPGTRLRVGEWYAVKVFKKGSLDDDSDLRAILNEIDVLRRLKSPYFVQLYDAFQSDTEVYLVMEYVDGVSLFDFISTKGHLSEREAMQVAQQLLKALCILHCHYKIVHRDLKPENIMLVKDTLQIKLIDFGFAEFIGTSAVPGCDHYHHVSNASFDSEDITTTPLCSLRFCAPEVLTHLVEHGSEKLTTTRGDLQKFDVFAAGVITYIMLSGMFPFNPLTPKALAAQIQQGVDFPRKSFMRVSPTAKDFCRLLLKADPSDRPLAYEALHHSWLQDTTENYADIHERHNCQEEPLDMLSHMLCRIDVTEVPCGLLADIVGLRNASSCIRCMSEDDPDAPISAVRLPEWLGARRRDSDSSLDSQ